MIDIDKLFDEPDLSEADSFENDEVFDEVKFKTNISSIKSEKIAQMIVCHQYLGFNENLNLTCMEELGRRREVGDTFDFESYIEKELSNMPKLNLNALNIRQVLTQVSGSKL